MTGEDIIMAINQFSPTYTYRPGQPPANQDWEGNESYRRGEDMRNVAKNTEDFFVAHDNTPDDVDPRPGYVRLKNLAAPGLIEKQTVSVDGYRTPDGNLQVTSQNDNSQTLLSIARSGQEIYMDRPVYVNDRYMPTLETLNQNADGTCSYAMAYHQHYRD
jgi:hypothetical protein